MQTGCAVAAAVGFRARPLLFAFNMQLAEKAEGSSGHLLCCLFASHLLTRPGWLPPLWYRAVWWLELV